MKPRDMAVLVALTLVVASGAAMAQMDDGTDGMNETGMPDAGTGGNMTATEFTASAELTEACADHMDNGTTDNPDMGNESGMDAGNDTGMDNGPTMDGMMGQCMTPGHVEVPEGTHVVRLTVTNGASMDLTLDVRANGTGMVGDDSAMNGMDGNMTTEFTTFPATIPAGASAEVVLDTSSGDSWTIHLVKDSGETREIGWVTMAATTTPGPIGEVDDEVDEAVGDERTPGPAIVLVAAVLAVAALVVRRRK